MENAYTMLGAMLVLCALAIRERKTYYGGVK